MADLSALASTLRELEAIADPGVRLVKTIRVLSLFAGAGLVVAKNDGPKWDAIEAQVGSVSDEALRIALAALEEFVDTRIAKALAERVPM
jgi:hypothetical protein